MKSKNKVYLVYISKILAFAVLYHLAARLGLKMAYLQANTSPVWPPTGIAIAVLMLFGSSLWPGVTLGVLVGSVLTGAPFFLAIGMAAGNTLEAVIAVYFLKHILHFHDALDRLNDVIGLTVVALITTAISATIGTSTLVLITETPSSAFFDIWITWWVGDLLGALVVAPFILVWLKRFSLRAMRKSIAESIGLILLIVFITWYVFSKTPPIDVTHQAMIYVIFPFIIWAALRFGQHGATAGIVLISAIAIWGTVNGTGPFAQESINESLILLQTFMGVVSITSLILAATTIERRKATQALQQRIEDLDTLNNASKSFLGNFDKTSVYHIICKIAVEKFNANCAWVEMQSGVSSNNAVDYAYGIKKKDIKKHMQGWKNKSDLKDK